MVTPRPAATLVLLRHGAAGIETLLMQRNARASFMPGAYVFPGGAVDPADAELQQGIGDGAARVAAIRECFEESGILLATPGGARPSAAATIDARARIEWREGLMNRHRTFTEFCREFQMTPRSDALVYHSRWITPPPGPKRFDTRFFLARCPDDQEAELAGSELTDHLWITPRDALQRAERGQLLLVTATRATLGSLLRFADIDAALSFSSGLTSVPEFPAPSNLP